MAVGCPHPDFLELTQEQMADWAAVFNREPWGFDVDDARHSSLLSLIANVIGAKSTPFDFSMRRMLDEMAADPPADHGAQLDALLGPLIVPDAPRCTCGRPKGSAIHAPSCATMGPPAAGR